MTSQHPQRRLSSAALKIISIFFCLVLAAAGMICIADNGLVPPASAQGTTAPAALVSPPEVPPPPEATPDIPLEQRQRLNCYESMFGECTAESIQAVIDQAGTTPTAIGLSLNYSKISKTITIPSGADIMFMSDGWEPELVRDHGFTDSMIEVEEGARLVLGSGGADSQTVKILNKTGKFNTETSSPTIRVEGELVVNTAEITGARGLSGAHVGAITGIGQKALITLNKGAKVSDNHRAQDSGSTQNGAGNIAVSDGAVLVMNDGEVSHGKGSDQNNGYGEAGGIGAYTGARVYINGGGIKFNSGWAGGIIGFSWPWNLPEAQANKDSHRNFIQINGGEISYNDSGFSGGGVLAFGNTVVEMNGGKISSNNSDNGGGVGTFDDYVSGANGSYAEVSSTGKASGLSPEEWSDLSPAAFVMKGGEVVDNTATRTGGGVNVVSNQVHLLGGNISENKAWQQGGGVYVSTKSYTAHLSNALVSENEATRKHPGADQSAAIGGGLWVCPTGTIKMYVNEGGAVIDNTAESYGADIAHDNYGLVSALELWLSNRILGGGDAMYFRDGGKSWDRYNADSPDSQIEEIFKDRKLQERGLKTVADADVKDRAQKAAKLTISKNKAPRGGGIGSNGGVVFGHGDEDVTDLEVLKAWANADDTPYTGEKPESISLQLMHGDHKVGDPVKVTPDEKGEWKYTFANLPEVKEGEPPYSVKELAVDGFETLVSEPLRSAAGRTQLMVNAKRPNLSIEKSWKGQGDDNLPESIKVDVLRTVDGKTETYKQVELTAQNEWKAELKDVPRFLDGKEVSYSVKESDVPGYTPTYATIERTADKFIARLTNTRDSTELKVKKVWIGQDAVEIDPAVAKGRLPEEVTVHVVQAVNGKEADYGDPITLNADNNWSATVRDLPTHVDGKEAQYSVREDEVKGFKTDYTSFGDAFTVVNKAEPTFLEVTKKWEDVTGDLPQEVTVHVVQTVDGKQTDYGDPLKLSAGNDWHAKVENLPQFVNGKPATYSVREDAVDGYTSKVSGEGPEFTVTNRPDTPPTPLTTGVSVDKQWLDADGNVLDADAAAAMPEVTVHVVQTVDGKSVDYGDPITLNADNNWSAEVDGLPASVDGKEATYSVREDAVDGYTSKVS
ncbi:Cna B-type domain-containing protein, partial [uncultured Corynebacterium sp.]|uniref:Cna B-type domain-containing protein n=1 Tax=uncultured Corynebacterium sp. TaxID=159447 RepID=UPI002601F44D